MTKAIMYDEHGNIINGITVPDGGKIKVPHLMMDSAMLPIIDTARHSPGSLATTDADLDAKAAALDARDKRLADAWRNPPSLATVDAKKDAAVVPRVPDSEAAAQRRDARLEQAWMGAGA